MAVKMRVIGGKWSVKMAPENGGTGTTLATSTALPDDVRTLKHGKFGHLCGVNKSC